MILRRHGEIAAAQQIEMPELESEDEDDFIIQCVTNTLGTYDTLFNDIGVADDNTLPSQDNLSREGHMPENSGDLPSTDIAQDDPTANFPGRDPSSPPSPESSDDDSDPEDSTRPSA